MDAKATALLGVVRRHFERGKSFSRKKAEVAYITDRKAGRCPLLQVKDLGDTCASSWTRGCSRA